MHGATLAYWIVQSTSLQRATLASGCSLLLSIFQPMLLAAGAALPGWVLSQ